MKIKMDFVTNSSSTSYIVFIPKDFVIEEKHFTPNIQLYDGGDLMAEADDDVDKVLDALNVSLDQLKTTGTLWADYEEDTEFSCRLLFYAISAIVEEQGFQLEVFDSASEDGKIHNVGIHSKKLSEIILADMLTNITVTVKGVNDDTTEDKQ